MNDLSMICWSCNSEQRIQMVVTMFRCAKFLETTGIIRVRILSEKIRAAWYENTQLKYISFYCIVVKLLLLYHLVFSLNQKTKLMGNNIDLIRKGDHEPKSETKHAAQFMSGQFQF